MVPYSLRLARPQRPLQQPEIFCRINDHADVPAAGR
jgi:hypothetical protein